MLFDRLVEYKKFPIDCAKVVSLIDWLMTQTQLISWKEPECGEEELILMDMWLTSWKQSKLWRSTGIQDQLFR